MRAGGWRRIVTSIVEESPFFSLTVRGCAGAIVTSQPFPRPFELRLTAIPGANFSNKNSRPQIRSRARIRWFETNHQLRSRNGIRG